MSTPQSSGAAGKDWSDKMDSKEAASKFNSAAAFVESGVQEVYEDACSICLEVFTEEEPLTLTTCNHDFHLQCILEWAQRSQECPMCWQPLSLKDSESQELLAACSHERAFHSSPASSVNTASFLRSAFEDFELQHRYSSSYPEEAELERRIMQHLAAAAAGMSRARLISGTHRVSSRNTTIQEGQQTYTSTAESTPPIGRNAIQAGTLVVGNNSRSISSDPAGRGRTSSSPVSILRSPPNNNNNNNNNNVIERVHGESQEGDGSPGINRHLSFGQSISFGENGRSPETNRAAGVESGFEGFHAMIARTGSGTPLGREGNGPPRPLESTSSGGDLASLGDALKSRWAAASSRFRERLRLRGGTVADLSAKAREVGAGVVRAIERMSDPGPSTPDRTSTDQNISAVLNTPEQGSLARQQLSNVSPSSSVSGARERERESERDGAERCLEGSSSPPSTVNFQNQCQGDTSCEGVQAGSVSNFNRLSINGDDYMEEIPLKGTSDSNSVGDSQHTTPLSI